MGPGDFLYIVVSGKTFPVRRSDVDRVLMEPAITRIPSGEQPFYGILYDGEEMVPLLDLSGGSFAQEEHFGRTCILLQRGDAKLAAAFSEIRDETVPEAKAVHTADVPGEEVAVQAELNAGWADVSGKAARELLALFFGECPGKWPEDNG